MRALHKNPAFQQLVSKRNRTRFVLAMLVLIAHAFFVGGIAFYRNFFAQPISDESTLTVGIVAAVAVIVTMILLEWVYILISEKRLDPLQKSISQELDQQ